MFKFAIHFGKWRSPVAHLYGVQGVASSNLVFPTKIPKKEASASFFIYPDFVEGCNLSLSKDCTFSLSKGEHRVCRKLHLNFIER